MLVVEDKKICGNTLCSWHRDSKFLGIFFIGLYLTLLLLPSASAFYLSIKSYDNAEGNKQIRIIVDDSYLRYYPENYYPQYYKDYQSYGKNDYYPEKNAYSSKHKTRYAPEYTKETIYKILDNLESLQFSYVDEKELYANRLLKQPVRKYSYRKSKY